MDKLVYRTAVALLLAFTGPQAATAMDLAVGPKISSLGLGLELSTRLTDRLNARLGVNAFDYSDSTTEDGIDYDADLELRSLAALVDWHPTGGGLRVSAGLLLNGNELTLEASGQDTYDIGDETYEGNLALDASTDLDNLAPYLGIGWGSAPAAEKGGWSFSIDVGVAYQGSPGIDLDASGTTVTRLSDGTRIDVGSDPTFQADLQREEDNLEDEIDDFELYPVLSVGVVYRF